MNQSWKLALLPLLWSTIISTEAAEEEVTKAATTEKKTEAVAEGSSTNQSELDQLRDAYRNASESKTATLIDSYRNALVKLRDQFTKGGDLQKALVVENTRKELDGEQSVPTTSEAPPELTRLTTIFSETKAKQLESLKGTYLDHLGKLKTKHQRSGDLTQALLVDDEIRTAQRDSVGSPEVDALVQHLQSRVKERDGHYYLLVETKVSWDSASLICKKLGGHLVFLESSSENNWLFRTYRDKTEPNRTNYWIGATDREKEGTWKWENGEPLTFKSWWEDNPNNNGGEHHALMCGFVDEWNDTNGDKAWWFVCEWESWPPAISAEVDVTDLQRLIP